VYKVRSTAQKRVGKVKRIITYFTLTAITMAAIASLNAMRKEAPQQQKIQQLLRNTMDTDYCKNSILATQKICARKQGGANAGTSQEPDPDAIESELTTQLGVALLNMKRSPASDLYLRASTDR
jgi:hypothetical protein